MINKAKISEVLILGSQSVSQALRKGRLDRWQGRWSPRYDPRRIAKGEPPMRLDYGPPKPLVAEYMRNESRFRVVERTDPTRFRGFLKDAQEAARQRYAMYQQLAGITALPSAVTTDDPAGAVAPGEEQ